MKVALLVLFAVAGALGATTRDVDWRVVGGAAAEEGQFPYQVSLRNRGSHSCGGSILDERTILCAAHCVTSASPSNLNVIAGSNSLKDGGDSYEVESIVVHEHYSASLHNNDVSILKLKSDIKFNEKVQPVPLRETPIGGDEECTLSGWGRTSYPGGSIPNNLQFVKLKTITFEQCKAAHVYPQVYESEVCTLTKKGEGACHGDSGGPLVDADGSQIGIVSWGNPCARGKPDVFTRVSSFMDWIEKNR